MVVERYPILKEEVGSLIPGYEISSLLDKKLAKWSTASRALALACLNNKKISRWFLNQLIIFFGVGGVWPPPREKIEASINLVVEL